MKKQAFPGKLNRSDYNLELKAGLAATAAFHFFTIASKAAYRPHVTFLLDILQGCRKCLKGRKARYKVCARSPYRKGLMEILSLRVELELVLAYKQSPSPLMQEVLPFNFLRPVQLLRTGPFFFAVDAYGSRLYIFSRNTPAIS